MDDADFVKVSDDCLQQDVLVGSSHEKLWAGTGFGLTSSFFIILKACLVLCSSCFLEKFGEQFQYP